MQAWLSKGKENLKRKINQTENSLESKKLKEEEEESVLIEKDNVVKDETKITISLVDINATVEKSSDSLEKRTMGKTWYIALEKEFQKDYFKRLKEFLEKEMISKTIFPPSISSHFIKVDQIYSWSLLCDLEQIKVVIIGQDPYHNHNQAHGLCFSVNDGIQFPPSLNNIFQEMTTDIPGFKKPKSGNLSSWARQGVLLLNAVLTVEAHKANSHQGKGWEQFTDSVIKLISQKRKHVVFLCWGNYAQKKVHGIDKSVHPSPLSAHRGFFGCKHFSKANEYLEKSGQTPIQWCLE